MAGIVLESDRRREALRTNLWFMPTVEVLAAVGLFVVTDALDRAVYHGELGIPNWVTFGTPDSARQVLTAIAAAIITVVGVVFSITIVALTLASTQFGPRMLRTFIRDRGTQVTLGTFVASFVYATAALVSIGSEFVPHISITVSIASMVLDLAVLIFFINHIANAIQLPNVIAEIAGEVSVAIESQRDRGPVDAQFGPSAEELLAQLTTGGGEVRVTAADRCRTRCPGSRGRAASLRGIGRSAGRAAGGTAGGSGAPADTGVSARTASCGGCRRCG
ncbi:DUF2254 family protein [Nocardia sp. NPDC020380]|uniref:DUF2254 family protein n=1 Tax=Nocardia sp. NPDC020380 TaxID=3364309 RepID=UPI00378A068A